MKLGVLTVPLYGMDLESALKYLHSIGVQAVELGCGGSPGKKHLDPAVYLHNKENQKKLKEILAENEIEIAAISAHGNAVHPNKEHAAAMKQDFENAVMLAEELGVSTVVDFSGCPGDSPTSQYPNWVTCTWPDDFKTILKYQWEEVLIPDWQNEVKFMREHGIHRVAFEMHPGFCVYNPETCLKLRDAVGPEIGANVDPSHLIWQGIDPCAAIDVLGKAGAIYHFHAKDTYVDPYKTAVNGVLDTKPFDRMSERSWLFRSVGYGHDEFYWKKIISALRMVGYDGVISIEHEDGLMSVKEGLEKAVSVLKDAIIYEDPVNEHWW